MRTIEHSVEIDEPLESVWAAWSRYERFPRFLEAVRGADTPGAPRWIDEIESAGELERGAPEVTERLLCRRISWTNQRGIPSRGLIAFVRLSPRRSRLDLRVEYEPERLRDRGWSASAIELIEHRVRTDLERFRRLVEHERAGRR